MMEVGDRVVDGLEVEVIGGGQAGTFVCRLGEPVEADPLGQVLQMLRQALPGFLESLEMLGHPLDVGGNLVVKPLDLSVQLGVRHSQLRRGHLAPERLEAVRFPRPRPVVRLEDARLQLVELVGDETLPPGDGLLSPVVVRDRVEVRFGDLDVIPEDPGELDLQGADPGAASFPGFELEDHLFAR